MEIMTTETEEMVYQACPCCQQEYFSKPQVVASERYTDLCKLCLEEAMEQELHSNEDEEEYTDEIY